MKLTKTMTMKTETMKMKIEMVVVSKHLYRCFKILTMEDDQRRRSADDANERMDFSHASLSRARAPEERRPQTSFFGGSQLFHIPIEIFVRLGSGFDDDFRTTHFPSDSPRINHR